MRVFSFLAIFLMIIGVEFAYGSELIDEVVAVVNGEIITQRQLDQVKFVTGGNLRMEGIIENFILCQEAEREEISVSSETVEKALAEIKGDFSSGEFQQALTQGGLTVKEYQEWLKRKILRDRLIYQKEKEIDKKIRIKDTEIREFYLRLKRYLDGQDILDLVSCEKEIEKYLKEEKKKEVLQEWLKELMAKAEIRIIKNKKEL